MLPLRAPPRLRQHTGALVLQNPAITSGQERVRETYGRGMSLEPWEGRLTALKGGGRSLSWRAGELKRPNKPNIVGNSRAGIWPERLRLNCSVEGGH